MYWRHRAALLMIALASLLIIGAADGLESLLRRVLRASASGVSFTDSGSGIQISTSDGIGRTLATPIASAAVIAFVRNLERHQDLGFAATWGAVLRRLWRLVAVQLLVLLLLVLLAVTIIGIPFAIRKYVDWQWMTDGFSIVESSSGGTEMRMRFDVAQERRPR